MKFISVCSGIEAASVAWEPLGWEAVAFAEVEPFPSAVLAHHWPNVPNLGDITSSDFIDRAKALGPCDVLVGGTPCQSFSVAGLRGGLEDGRGNLALRFLQIVDALQPRFVVWENVPGVLSSNGGKDFECILNGYEDLGYIADVDILDAQFFGVPQRRRRVFVVCQNVRSLAKSKTISSALTISQCLTECLRLVLDAAREEFPTNSANSAVSGGEPCRSLQRRMRLFSLDKPEQARMWRENLDALLPLSVPEQDASESLHGRISRVDSKNIAATKSPGSTRATDTLNESPSIASSLSSLWEDCLQTMSECITSTPASETTESKIFTCAQLLLNIAERISRSPTSSPTFWSAASSASIALRVYINYARRTANDLFGQMGWVCPWRDFVAQAERTDLAFRHLGIDGRSEILPFGACLSGHPSPSREARPGVAACLESSSPSGGFRQEPGEGLTVARAQRAGHGSPRFDPNGDNLLVGPLLAESGRCQEQAARSGHKVAATLRSRSSRPGVSEPDRGGEDDFNLVCGTLNANGKASGSATQQDAETGMLVTHSLRADGFDASEDGTGRGTPLIPVDMRQASRGEKLTNVRSTGSGGPPGDGIGKPGDPAFTVSERGQAVAFAPFAFANCGGETALGLSKPGVPPITTRNGDPGSAVTLQGVRRLTPRECERLQGFPDGWTLVPYRKKMAADGPRYKAIGNSFAVPVVRWIGQRIQLVDGQE